MALLRLEERGVDALIVWMDDLVEPVNTLKRELADELHDLMTRMASRPAIRVVVFASAKPDSFVAGADLKMLQSVATAQEAESLALLAQSVQQGIAAMGPVSVAAIHGAALGGGLELAMCMRGRVASDDDVTRLGLPEVQLGLLPAGGGTQRLPLLVGLPRALDLLLTGRRLSARQACRIGLVDEVVPLPNLIEAAIARGRTLAGGRPRGHVPFWSRWRDWILGANPIGRRWLLDRARKRVHQRTRGRYPAPDRIIDVVETGLAGGINAGLRAEAAAFGELVVSPESRQLVNLFFATTALGKQHKERGTAPAPPVTKIGVLGAGFMGTGIAYLTLSHTGARVRLKDVEPAAISRSLRSIKSLIDRRMAQGAIDQIDASRMLERLTMSMDYSGFANCDLVIEAAPEHLELKQRILRETEANTGERTIYASNTSAIPISEIAVVAHRPQQVVGMHYFSPVEKMPLLEVVIQPQTADWVTAICVATGVRQGKTVIVVRDKPGFFTTRVLAPYLNEAALLISEGIAIEEIDGCLVDFGFPVGPVKLLDEIGIDVAKKVGETLAPAFGARMQAPDSMDRLLDGGRLGRKSGKGFYRYQGGRRPPRVDPSVYRELGIEKGGSLPRRDIVERCVLLMVNESLHCLGEGVLSQARDGDVGAVLGLGFPAYLGGPFRYLEARGASAVRDRLQYWSEREGERFKPAPLLDAGEQAVQHLYQASSAPE